MFDEEDKKLAQGGVQQGAPVEDMFSSVDGGVPENLPFAPSAGNPAPMPPEAPASLPIQPTQTMPPQMDVRAMQRATTPPPPDDILAPQQSSRRSRGGMGRLFGVLFITLISIGLVAGAVYLGLKYLAQQKVAELQNQENTTTTTPIAPQAPTTPTEPVIVPTTELTPEQVPESIPSLPSANAPDADGDELTDAEENQLGTDPSLTDTDADGLNDQEEVRVYGTDPLNQDTDGDTYIDGVEVTNGFNPNGTGRLFQPLPPRTETK